MAIQNTDQIMSLDDHLQDHKEHYDPMLKKHDLALYGPDGTDGLNKTITAIETNLNNLTCKVTDMNKTMRDVGVGLILAIATAILAFVLAG